MVASVQAVTPNFSGVKYDGTNGADIVALFTSGALVNDDGNQLDFTFTAYTAPGYPPQSVSIPKDQWFVFRRRGPNTDATGVFTQDVYEIYWKPVVDMLEPVDRAKMSYFGSGVGTRSTALGIGASGTVDTRLTPPIPAALLGAAQIKSDLLATTGLVLGSVSITATPVVVTPFVAAATVSGVLVPAHTLVRTTILNSGLSVLSSAQVFTTAHV